MHFAVISLSLLLQWSLTQPSFLMSSVKGFWRENMGNSCLLKCDFFDMYCKLGAHDVTDTWTQRTVPTFLEKFCRNIISSPASLCVCLSCEWNVTPCTLIPGTLSRADTFKVQFQHSISWCLAHTRTSDISKSHTQKRRNSSSSKIQSALHCSVPLLLEDFSTSYSAACTISVLSLFEVFLSLSMLHPNAHF